MMSYRTNLESGCPSPTAGIAETSAEHGGRIGRVSVTSLLPTMAAAAGAGGDGSRGNGNMTLPPSDDDGSGDIIYGAAAIARYLFADDGRPKRARRRVFHIWAHHRDRNEAAGLFKISGALCLSKSQWKKFHKL